jgi:dTDP-4-amino-4,6-dideoxygalactose transaminase
MAELALLGGPRAVTSDLKLYRSVGQAERDAVNRVLDSGCLSAFIGVWGPEFDGGPEVRRLEEAWAQYFNIKHAVSVNSATSGLYAAMGAVGVGPGDEVIVPPYSMSATVMAPLVYGGIPVFADIDEDTFCIDVKQVEKLITPKTKAIIAVNLYGHPARLKELRALADKHSLFLVEDNAQGPGAKEFDKFAGTIGHIGVFSLNYHKHIHSGEGGICTTDDDSLALRLRLIRNHGENAVAPAGMTDISNMIGFNYRLSELSAAVALAQLEHVDKHVEPRIEQAQALTRTLKGMDGLTPPVVRDGCHHVYYGWPMKVDAKKLGMSRKTVSAALKAEGFINAVGYVAPLYRLPIFQQRIAMGKDGFPFNLTERRYEGKLCSVVERMHEEELIAFPNCSYEITDAQTKQLCEALEKVYNNRAKLREWENKQGSKEGAALAHR